MNDTPARKRPPVGSHPCIACGSNHTAHGAHCPACSKNLDTERSQRHNAKRSDLHTGRWQQIRDAILARDHRTCVTCATRDRLTVHHINHTHNDQLSTNLVTLCSSCHAKVEAEYARGHDGAWTRRLTDHLVNSPHHAHTAPAD